jgi:acyl-CoA synthetase (AMP-forming)/AMP-acid ligase II
VAERLQRDHRALHDDPRYGETVRCRSCGKWDRATFFSSSSSIACSTPLSAGSAMWVGVPVAPGSSACSLLSQDHARLRHIVGAVTPGRVFASGPDCAQAIEVVAGAGVGGVLTQGRTPGRSSTPFASRRGTTLGAAADAAHAKVGPQTIANFLFTSGTTKLPKGVVNAHRMQCANQQMLALSLAFNTDEPPVLLDWLLWNHTFGGNHHIGIALYNGGTLHIDDGKPTPQGMPSTWRKLREIAPTIRFNVPRGFEEIVGLPCPGVEVTLPADGDGPHAKTEVRCRGTNVTPGD